MSKKLMACMAFLTAMLIPSVALAAGPADLFYGIGVKIWRQIIQPSFFTYSAYGDWGILMSIVASGLTIYGLWKLDEADKIKIGRVSGFMVLPIALMIMWMIIGMGIGLALGLIQGGISSFWSAVPFINLSTTLVGLLSKATWYIVMFFIIVGAIKHLASSGLGYIKQFMGIVKDIIVGPFQGNVSGFHIALGIVMISAIINRRELNEPLYYAPSIAGAAFGIYQFVTKTGRGQKAAERARAILKHEPRASDGAWKCPNKELDFVRDKEGRKIPDLKDPGRFKTEWKQCPGPGGAYEGWNPKDAPFCLSPTCDHPNPHWVKCEGCGYAGDDKKEGFRREVFGAHQKCPKCGHDHPPPPEQTPFHEPGEDRAHPGTPGAPPPPATPDAPAPPPPVVVPDFVLERQCSSCKELYDAGRGYRGCPHCGTPFGTPAGTATTPDPAPEEPVPPPPQEGEDEDYDILNLTF
ncbi:MAG: hypothetical protein V1880_02980 [Patescibacteria group bacterium]